MLHNSHIKSDYQEVSQVMVTVHVELLVNGVAFKSAFVLCSFLCYLR